MNKNQIQELCDSLNIELYDLPFLIQNYLQISIYRSSNDFEKGKIIIQEDSIKLK